MLSQCTNLFKKSAVKTVIKDKPPHIDFNRHNLYTEVFYG